MRTWYCTWLIKQRRATSIFLTKTCSRCGTLMLFVTVLSFSVCAILKYFKWSFRGPPPLPICPEGAEVCVLWRSPAGRNYCPRRLLDMLRPVDYGPLWKVNISKAIIAELALLFIRFWKDCLDFNPDRFLNSPKPSPFVFTAFQVQIIKTF